MHSAWLAVEAERTLIEALVTRHVPAIRINAQTGEVVTEPLEYRTPIRDAWLEFCLALAKEGPGIEAEHALGRVRRVMNRVADEAREGKNPWLK